MVKKKKKKVLKKKTAKKKVVKKKTVKRKKAKSTASRLKKKGAPENKMQTPVDTTGERRMHHMDYRQDTEVLPTTDTEQVVSDDTYEAPVDEAVSFHGNGVDE